ncbi:tautomerase family protein [Mycetohabitans sp. B2]|jgi:phenylpyruvate tautomerase PptA (4-oxalocrotonate tautomerase family)|uniref:tautomerase family protein n=1 Tax=Mycetohabitans sp. B2 TaxID=2841274 RepID=UPI001F37CBB6|nr:tautomerase family protein [Mycetohabitans sp. B2]
MPLIKIEEQRPRTADEKARLVDLLFSVLRQTLGVSPNELQARYQTFKPEDFYPPAGTGEYLGIEITLFAGRSLDVKRRLYERIVAEVAQARQIDPSRILVLLREEPLDNWGLHGGHAATDLKFDYAIAI